MFHSPVVTVQGIDDIRAALSGGARTVLRSPDAAVLFLGPAYWRALIARAEAEFPGQIEADILDCADAPGLAMAALRAGCRYLLLDPACPGFAAVQSAAATIGARVAPRT